MVSRLSCASLAMGCGLRSNQGEKGILFGAETEIEIEVWMKKGGEA